MASKAAWRAVPKLAARVPAGKPSIVYSAQCFPVRHTLQPLAATRYFTASRLVEAKKYSKDHEWIELDTDGTTGTIGLSTYAANALGDVVYVELPALDTEVSQGDTIGAVESVKSASDLLTPVSGTILETNSELESKPGNLNKNPEGGAWIAKIKVKDTTEFDTLMDADAYAKFTTD